MSRKFVVILALSAVSGCATQGSSTQEYTPDKPIAVRNEKVLPRPQEVVWDELVRELSKSFYVINNIERESRIINVSFNSNSPGEYINCGKTRRTYEQGGDKESFEYEVAKNSSYKMAIKRPDNTFSEYAVVHRHTSLEGRANIYIAPETSDPGKTRVSVNTRYIFSTNITGQTLVQNMYGKVVAVQPIPQQAPLSVIFNTNKPGSADTAGTMVMCFDNGKLENDILGMTR